MSPCWAIKWCSFMIVSNIVCRMQEGPDGAGDGTPDNRPVIHPIIHKERSSQPVLSILQYHLSLSSSSSPIFSLHRTFCTVQSISHSHQNNQKLLLGEYGLGWTHLTHCWCRARLRWPAPRSPHPAPCHRPPWGRCYPRPGTRGRLGDGGAQTCQSSWTNLGQGAQYLFIQYVTLGPLIVQMIS